MSHLWLSTRPNERVLAICPLSWAVGWGLYDWANGRFSPHHPIASGSQTDLLECLPHKGQVGVDVMPGRYFNKLHPVRVSLGIVSTGDNGHDHILRAVNNGDGGWWGRGCLVETAV